MNRSELLDYLDSYLRVSEIEDYGPQGLQVDAGNDTINRVALAVDTSPNVIQAASDWGADLLLVHHGILWGKVEPITGPLGRRVRMLIQGGINLYGAHLPLDAHPEVGNNAVLAEMMGITVKDWWCAPKGTPIGVLGEVSKETQINEFVNRVEERLKASCRLLDFGSRTVQKVAILSGFGADEVAGAKAAGADTYLTGETSHSNYWDASDYGINVIFAGHYATETVGVQALGRHLEANFGLTTHFFDFPTAM